MGYLTENDNLEGFGITATLGRFACDSPDGTNATQRIYLNPHHEKSCRNPVLVMDLSLISPPEGVALENSILDVFWIHRNL